MGMNPIHLLTGLGEVMHQLIGKIFQMRPKLFLAQITLRTKRKAQDSSTRSDQLHWTPIVRSNPTVLHKACHHIDPFNLGTLGQAAHQIQHVEGLAAGVRITTKLQIPGTEQTVQVQMKDTDTPSHNCDPFKQQRNQATPFICL